MLQAFCYTILKIPQKKFCNVEILIILNCSVVYDIILAIQSGEGESHTMNSWHVGVSALAMLNW